MHGLEIRIKEEYPVVLSEMDNFCQMYLDKSNIVLRQLVGGLVEAILADETFEGLFDVGGRWVKKSELSEITEFSLQPFLVSVWSNILSNYPNAKDGIKTYFEWTSSGGASMPREITTRIGTDRAMKIKVITKLPESPCEEKTPDLGEKKGPTEKTAEPETVEAEIVEDVPYPETKTVNKEGRTYIQHAEQNIINIEYLGELHV